MGRASQMEDEKKYLVKDVHRVALIGVRFVDSPNGGFIVHHNSKSSSLVEVKSKKHLDPILMELKESVLGMLNVLFSQGGWCYLVPREIMSTRCSQF